MKALAGMTILGLLLLCVAVRIDLMRVGYHIERLKERKVALVRERDELHVKVSALTAPERIARVAKDQLGMTQPERGQVVVVRARPAPPAEPAPRVALAELKLAKAEIGGRMP